MTKSPCRSIASKRSHEGDAIALNYSPPNPQRPHLPHHSPGAFVSLIPSPSLLRLPHILSFSSSCPSFPLPHPFFFSLTSFLFSSSCPSLSPFFTSSSPSFLRRLPHPFSFFVSLIPSPFLLLHRLIPSPSPFLLPRPLLPHHLIIIPLLRQLGLAWYA